MRVGTSIYIAPEIVLSNNYDQKCNVYSFSIIIFQLLTKKLDNDDKEKNASLENEKKNLEFE
jgi:serine/threonine protein kinase